MIPTKIAVSLHDAPAKTLATNSYFFLLYILCSGFYASGLLVRKHLLCEPKSESYREIVFRLLRLVSLTISLVGTNQHIFSCTHMLNENAEKRPISLFYCYPAHRHSVFIRLLDRFQKQTMTVAEAHGGHAAQVGKIVLFLLAQGRQPFLILLGI